MSNVSIRKYFSVLNVFIICIRNTAKSKSNPLLCTHVDLYMFKTLHPRANLSITICAKAFIQEFKEKEFENFEQLTSIQGRAIKIVTQRMTHVH